MSNPAVVILAAGGAKRFGSAKQIAIVDGKPLMQWVIDSCRELGGQLPVYVVLGAYREKIKANLNLNGLQVLYNPHWSQGISTSIKLAVTTLQNCFDSLLFVGGDQYQINHADIQSLLQCGDSHSQAICSARYAGILGIPVLFPQIYYSRLLALTGDQGAKKLLMDPDVSTVAVDMPHALFDIDTIEDIP